MCKELVRLTTNDVNNAITVVSSREVAEKFNKEHKEVIYAIEGRTTKTGKIKNIGLINGLIEIGGKSHLSNYFIESKYLDNLNREQKEYLITKDGFSLLAMGFTGQEALKWKLKYIKAFNLMENELKARQETRHIGVSIRKSLTDTIKNKVDDEGNFKKFAYSNYSKLVYKKVIGMQVKKYKELHGLKTSDNLRDFLDIEQLEKVQALESKIAFYIEMRKDLTGNDKEIYQEVKKYIDSIS